MARLVGIISHWLRTRGRRRDVAAVRAMRHRVVLAALAVGAGTALLTGGCSGNHSTAPAAAPARPPTVATTSAPGSPPASTGPTDPSAHALATNTAVAAFASFNRAFFAGTPRLARLGFYKKSLTGGHAAFWEHAEMIETAEDYWDLTSDPTYKRLVAALCDGFVGMHGTNWMNKVSFVGHRYLGPRATDDILWMVIVTARAYGITGDVRYLNMATSNFDMVWARAWSADLGGGLWWRSATDRPQKNAVTNGEAVIAACELYRATHDSAYLAKATALFSWMTSHLFVASSGRVYDYVGISHHVTTVNTAQYTYDQGIVIGAADLLYQITRSRAYYDDAFRALAYTRTNLTTTGGILPAEATYPDQDSGGFKGIFARWAVRFTRDNHITAFDAWFRRNAETAWSHRNAAGLMGYDWTAPTSSSGLYAFDCSSGVAMLETLLPKAR